MALRAKVLQKKAEKFELKKLQLLEISKERVSALEPLLQDVYASRRPKPTEYEVRRDLVRVFNEIAKEIYGNSTDIPVVVEFGSFVMDLFSTTSDLDLSVNFRTTAVPFPREKKIQTLRKFARKLYAIQSNGHISGVLPITTAKVPILKCVDRGTGVECDISVENRDGILKSQIIHIISSIDERFKKLSFLMKTWAKANGINSSKDKTLNSLSLILLVAFHLQTRNPPILPPFSAIFKVLPLTLWLVPTFLTFIVIALDGTDPATVVKSLSDFVNYGQRNRESLAELFITLLIKLSSVEKLWAKGLCASPCRGSWISKTWSSKVACISVEDFTDQSQNVSRAVGQAEVKQIYKCIDVSLRYIFAFINGQVGVKLKDLLFGQDGVTGSIPRGVPNLPPIAALPGVPSQLNKTTRLVTGKRKKQGQQAVLLESCLAKKILADEGWRGVADRNWGPPHVESRGGTQHVGGWNEVSAGGWERIEQTGTRDWVVTEQPRGGGWGGNERPSLSGWGASKQLIAGDWGRTQQPVDGGTQQLSGGGWGRTQQSSGGGSWGGTQQAGGGGWDRSQQSGGGGWGGTQQLGNGGWGGTQQSGGGGWSGAQHSSVGDWGGTQQHNVGGGGRSSDPLRRTDNYIRRY